ncbi:MAG: hypothetical protein LLG14_17450, partial [Nocardiaceae bacterium]|nr:hypothetical protein [Nocardiaceae bacterium]
MNEHHEIVAEITKLARLLDVDRRDLDLLCDIPPAAIAEFREQATNRVYDADAILLERIGAAAKLVPIPIAVEAARLAFGPLLCAAIAGLVEPSRGAAIAARLPTRFLAETAIQLDPRRAAAIIGALPPGVVTAVSEELLQRKDYVTMGRLVGAVPESSLRAALAVTGDADILRIG